MDFHSRFLDDSTQNSSTTCDIIKKFIHWMYANTLSIKGGVIYDTIVGCIKQYRFENAMWLLSVLPLTHRVILD